MSPSLAPGTRLGPYESSASLVRRYGRGLSRPGRPPRPRRRGQGPPSTFVSDPDRLKRFQREARAAGQLNHPNIIAIHDVGTEGTFPTSSRNSFPGKISARRSSRPVPAPPPVVYAIQIAKGLSRRTRRGSPIET